MTAQPTTPTTAADATVDNSPLRYVGWYLTTIGISHFLFPRRWDRMTAIAYRQPLRRKTLGFGLTETAMGILFLRKQTRHFGIAAVVAQGIFLIYSFVSFRRGHATEAA